MYKIMVVEDDPRVRSELSVLLERYGYQVKAPTDFSAILDVFQSYDPHLVLLDINLPVWDGFWLCGEIRKISPVPVICVTARDADQDQVLAITLGSDDYIVKPYSGEVLLARISAVLRRSYGQRKDSDLVRHRDLAVDLAGGTAARGDLKVELSKNELRILHTLIISSGDIVSRDTLMERLWQTNSFVDDNTLTVNITRLRKRLEELGLGDMIQTRRGMGYLVE